VLKAFRVPPKQPFSAVERITIMLQSLVRSSNLLLIRKHGGVRGFPFYLDKCVHLFLTHTAVTPLRFDLLSWVGKDEWDLSLGAGNFPQSSVLPWERVEQVTVIHPLSCGWGWLTSSILELYCLREKNIFNPTLVLLINHNSYFLLRVSSSYAKPVACISSLNPMAWFIGGFSLRR